MGLLFVEKTVWYGCRSDGRTMGLQFLRSRRMFAVYFLILQIKKQVFYYGENLFFCRKKALSPKNSPGNSTGADRNHPADVWKGNKAGTIALRQL